MYAVRARQLGKRYYLDRKKRRELWALRDVTFEAERGEILGIIGANGAGKTTLLRILARGTSPTEGRVKGHGKVLPLLSLGAGFEPDLSTRENIYLNAAMRGIPGATVGAKFDEIVAFADIEDYLDDPLKSGPSGLYLRLAFSMIITLNPHIILADEVLAVGDVEFQEACLRKVSEACEQGAAVLYVSHNMSEIRSISSRVMWLKDGKIERIGAPEEVVSAYEAAALAMGGFHHLQKGKDAHNRFGSLLFTKLHHPDGTVARVLRTHEDAVLTMTFRLARRGLTVRCGFDLRTDGHAAFRTVCPDVLSEVEPGVYSASVAIPKGLLSDTLYMVDSVVVIDHEHETYPMSQRDAVIFQVHAPEGGLDHLPPSAAALRPNLAWQVSDVSA